MRAGETPLAWFEPDLDARLRFARGLVVLTDQRYPELGAGPGGGRRRLGGRAIAADRGRWKPQIGLADADETAGRARWNCSTRAAGSPTGVSRPAGRPPPIGWSIA